MWSQEKSFLSGHWAVKIKSGDDLERKTEKIGVWSDSSFALGLALIKKKNNCLAVINRPCDNVSSAIDLVSNFIPSHFLKDISAH